MRIRHFMAVIGVLVAATVMGTALISATPAGALTSHSCPKGMYWNTVDNACDDLPTKTPPPTPGPTLGPPTHYVCYALVVCDEYVSRTATHYIAAQLDYFQNTINASVSSVAAVICGALGTVALLPGVVCGIALGLEVVDVAFTIDRFHYASANNDCMEIPQWVPWSDPIPYNGPECFN